jgi:hypothetical protein
MKAGELVGHIAFSPITVTGLDGLVVDGVGPGPMIRAAFLHRVLATAERRVLPLDRHPRGEQDLAAGPGDD